MDTGLEIYWQIIFCAMKSHKREQRTEMNGELADISTCI